MKICWNAIVKNESARIERAMASIAPYIDSWVVVDTGSTDDTKEKIASYFSKIKIPGEVRQAPFNDWSQARNAALDWARKLQFVYEWDYVLFMDADMELVVKDNNTFRNLDLTVPAYDMWQRAGGVHYQNRRLLKSGIPAKYVGVTHEYLDGPSGVLVPDNVAYFIDHADGANRPEKFKRDIRLLKQALKTDPDNARYFYYLASSYRDAGEPERAAKWFQRRIKAGGWDEEVWQAHVNLAHCYKSMGRDSDFVANLLAAYSRRPTRAEPMYDLANYYRNRDDCQPAALACAEAVAHLPKSTDALFVNDFVYKAGIPEEISITAFYVPGKKQKGYEVSDKLSMQKSDYWGSIQSARANIYFYLDPLSRFAPSFKWSNVDFTPPEHWVAMNPSVCSREHRLWINVRCVNYRIDEHGRYLIRNTETGGISNDNPITTRNFIGLLDINSLLPATGLLECYQDGNMPVKFPLVIGHEDVRIWCKGSELWTSSTVRQIHEDGNCEQVLARIEDLKLANYKRMLREPRETEKNWAPITDGGEIQRFMWRPGSVIDENGHFTVRHEVPFRVDNMSGSSQVIPFRDGHLAILHTANFIPGTGLRHYYHRFIKYDQHFRPVALSLPFYFNDKGIEFCGGLCLRPCMDELVISYGWRDCEARIGTVKCKEVEDMLCSV